MRHASHKAVEEYQVLLGNKVAKEVARSVLPQNLPQNLYTAFYVTGNLRAWFDVLHLRNGSHGHPQAEIVEVARKIEAHVSKLFPITYGAWLKAKADK